MNLQYLDTVMSFAVLMLLLSLQITVLVQMVIAISGLRGWNLSLSLTQLFKQVDNELGLKAYATTLAREILKHPALTHSWSVFGRRKATAIRPAELFRVLDDLAKNPDSALDKTKREVLAAVLGKTRAGETPEVAEKANQAVAELGKLFPGETLAVHDAVARILRKGKRFEEDVSAWFDTIMDRSTDRFVLYTRWITVAIAFVLVVILHIDSIQIFKQLSTSSDVRAKIVQQVDATLRQAGAVMTDTAKPKPLASDAIRAMKEDLADPSAKDLVTRVPGDLTTRQAGQDWLRRNFSDPKLAMVLPAFEKRFEDVTIARVKELGVSLDSVKSNVEQAGLQIIPQPLPGWKTYPGDQGLHLVGVLMSGLFLSLGAPFWFNALRQLANLRPVLAGKMEAGKTDDTAS
jgi:hypothetical protein